MDQNQNTAEAPPVARSAIRTVSMRRAPSTLMPAPPTTAGAGGDAR